MIGTFKFFRLSFGIVIDHYTKGPQHPHDTWGMFIQIFSDAMFKKRNIDEIFVFGYPDSGAKASDGVRCVASPSHPRYRRHSWIVPAGHKRFCN